jgi:hypothetical protein
MYNMHCIYISVTLKYRNQTFNKNHIHSTNIIIGDYSKGSIVWVHEFSIDYVFVGDERIQFVQQKNFALLHARLQVNTIELLKN